MTIQELKKLSKEEFLKLEGATEELYQSLQNAKSGYIEIRKENSGAGDRGYTQAFGEGISLRIDNLSTWYMTSIIQKIDWENNYFTTLNSKYYFKFTEDEKKES